jgi:hypothetical protein
MVTASIDESGIWSGTIHQYPFTIGSFLDPKNSCGSAYRDSSLVRRIYGRAIGHERSGGTIVLSESQRDDTGLLVTVRLPSPSSGTP